jgi:hypothetical protein
MENGTPCGGPRTAAAKVITTGLYGHIVVLTKKIVADLSYKRARGRRPEPIIDLSY